MSEPLKARKTPCASCPYRCDVPSGVWHESEYDKLPKYDGEIGEQVTNLPDSVHPFICHQVDGHLCSGWVANTGDPTDKLAIRLGISSGQIDPSVAQYETDVPLFKTGQEASEHGKREIGAPSLRAAKTIDKVVTVRKLRGSPVQRG